MSLKEYKRKRDFTKTPEPSGIEREDRGPLRFVVQKHAASRLHYDLRLEWDGTFKSWAVPKGPSINPMDQRLAVFVEDHPLEYGSFEGIIPAKNYGAGTVLLWDAGTLIERSSSGRADSEEALAKGFSKGHLTVILNGQKLKGEFALVKIDKDGKGDPKAWLLLKKRDRFSSSREDILEKSDSVKTGRTLEQITNESETLGDVWIPGKGSTTTLVPYPFEETEVLTAKAVKADVAPPAAAGEISPTVTLQDIPNSPFPRGNKPMQPVHFPVAFAAKGWWFAPDFGGLHVVCEREGPTVRILTRGSLKKTYPTLTDTLKNLPQGVFDIELLRREQDLWQRPDRDHPPTHVMVSDASYFLGKSLKNVAARHRQTLLQDHLKVSEHLLLREFMPDYGEEAFTTFLSQGACAMFAIAQDGNYLPSINKDFLKIDGPSDKEGIGSTLPPSMPKLSETTARAIPIHLDADLPANGKRIGDRGPVFSNLEKTYWPDENISKGDLVRYYQLVSDAILPHLIDRPLSLNRHPDGIRGESFFHKNMTGYFPPWFKTHPVTSPSSGKTINYAFCQNEASLLYLANFGCIEINPWFSRLGSLTNPDFVAIDLDPDKTSFAEVLFIALRIHELLDTISAPHWVKTSGSSGLHICIPTDGTATFEEGRQFAERICQIIVQKHPALVSVERNPSKRKRKMYLDYMQNRRSQTLASVYSVRPKPFATVSTPVTWEEVQQGFAMTDFTISTVPARIERLGDLWGPMLSPGCEIDKLQDRLDRLTAATRNQ